STPRAHRTPTISTASPQVKKRKQTAEESSSPKKLQKITIRKKKQSSTPIPPPGDDRERERERDEVAEATILSLTLHKTTLAAEAQENIANIQEKLDDEEIEKMVEGNKDEESYASEFVDSMINDDVDDSGTKIEPESHKEHPKIVNDDDQIEKEKNNEEIEKEKKDEEIVMEKDDDDDNDDDIEKVDGGVKEKCNVDVATDDVVKFALISKINSLLMIYSWERFEKSFDHCNKVVLELTFTKTNEMINKEMPCLVNLAVNKDCEVDPNAQEIISKEFSTHAPKMIEDLFQKHMQHITLNLYPTTSSSTAGKSTADLQQQLYLKMKLTPQDQVADPEL
nr:hypothetical protein [Tanacetum cinerariifolium]